MNADRRACIIGEGLVRDRRLAGRSGRPCRCRRPFTMSDGSAWEFNVVAVYHPLRKNFDDRQVFFRYVTSTRCASPGRCVGTEGVGASS